LYPGEGRGPDSPVRTVDVRTAGGVHPELFPTRIRYSGVSIAYRLTAIFADSLAPIIAVAVQGPALVGAGVDLRRHRLRD